MSKHTPGPWCVDADGILVGAKGGFSPFGGCGCCGSPWMSADSAVTALADARLIAAAPDLLEVLEQFVAWVDAPSESAFSDSQLAAARAAIAKAKGEQA